MSEPVNIYSALNVPRRQSPVAVLLILFKTLGRIASQAWPLLIVVVLDPHPPAQPMWLTAIAVAFALIPALMAVVTYFRFFFYMTQQELVIERAIIGKRRLVVPFGRIQTIHIRETVIHRFFGVVGLDIDTAGSKGKEFSIAALKKDHAEFLQEFLLKRKEEAISDGAPIEIPLAKAQEAKSTQPAADQLLLALSLSDLLKIGVSGNHLQTAGLIFGFLFPIYQTVQDALGNALEQQIETAVSFLFQSLFLILFLVLPLFIFFSFLLTLFRTVLRFYNLRFFRTTEGFRVESGLLVRLRLSALTHKIQQIHWETNPIFRLFNMYALHMKQASSAEVSAHDAISVPGSTIQQVERVREVYFPGVGSLAFRNHEISPRIIGRRVIWFGVLPALLLITITFSSYGSQSLLWLLFIPLQFIFSVYYHRRYRVRLHESGVHIRRGIWFETNDLLLWHKVQSVKIRQSLYQRRHHLATLIFFTAAGEVRIPFFSLQKACALRDYVMYQVETDTRDWM